MKDLRFGELNDVYGALLSERQSAILREYFDFDLSYAEIGQAYGITRQAVGQIIETSIKQLESFEDKLHLLKLASELKQFHNSLTDETTKQSLATIIEKFF